MKRRIGVVLLMLGISVAALPTFTHGAHAGNVQLQPLEISKTLNDQNPTVQQGDSVRYRIEVCNPNDVPVWLDEIKDTLASGFEYEFDSTHGMTGADPDPIVGQTLTWDLSSDEIELSASGDEGECDSLFFEASVSNEEAPGVYCNEASVTSEAGTSATGLTAPVQVTELQVDAVQQLTCAQATPPAIVRKATPTSTATARATATATAAPPTKTATPQSTVLAAQATPKAQQPAALPSTGSGSGNGRGVSSWVLALAATLIVAGAGLTLAGRKRA